MYFVLFNLQQLSKHPVQMCFSMAEILLCHYTYNYEQFA